MGKIKLTKGELKRQRDALGQYKRYLPTLQLKKQQLQLEILRKHKSLAETKTREKSEKDLAKIEKVGEVFAQVHSLNVTLGDTKPENVILDPDDNVYLLDFEQASHDGDKAWDVAVFLYYSGHYLQPLRSSGKAESIVRAFASGYLKGGGDVAAIKKAGNSKYTRIFSVFTMPSVILAISNACRKVEVPS